jgi:hypothetical protein
LHQPAAFGQELIDVLARERFRRRHFGQSGNLTGYFSDFEEKKLDCPPTHKVCSFAGQNPDYGATSVQQIPARQARRLIRPAAPGEKAEARGGRRRRR